MKGDGIIKDIQKAIEYFVKASKDGNKKASFILGEIYMKGEYIPKDKIYKAKEQSDSIGIRIGRSVFN